MKIQGRNIQAEEQSKQSLRDRSEPGTGKSTGRPEKEGEWQEARVEGSQQVGRQTTLGPQAVVGVQIFSWDFPEWTCG